MTYLVLALILSVFVDLYEAWNHGRERRAMERRYAREREVLLDRICHLAQNPWNPAPAETWEAPETVEQLVGSPEQEPDW